MVQERQFAAYISEYEKLRDGTLQRVVLQNNNKQQALIATGLLGALLGALYPTEVNQRSIDAFYWIAACMCFVYALLIELLIGNWIFQLAMMFQIVIYQTWRKTNHLSDLVSDASTLFRWEDSRPKDPWLQILGKSYLLNLLQIGFLYGLVAVAWFGSSILLISDVGEGNWSRAELVVVFELVVLIIFVLLEKARTQILNRCYQKLDEVRIPSNAADCGE